MSYRNAPKSVPGKIHKSPVKVESNQRQRNIGLDKNTTLQGSAIDIGTDSDITSVKNKTIEKEFKIIKEKYSFLQKTVEQLRAEVKSKKSIIVELQVKLQSQSEANTLVAKQAEEIRTSSKKIVDHSTCNIEIQKLKQELHSKNNECKDLKASALTTVSGYEEELEKIKKAHADVLIAITKQHDSDILSLKENFNMELKNEREDHQQILASKNAIIEKLKLQIAESLGDKSKERHHQIEELMKELNRVSKEAEYVKSALRNMKSNKKDCQKCVFYETKCKELSVGIYLKFAQRWRSN